jgi:hypothetical protein
MEMRRYLNSHAAAGVNPALAIREKLKGDGENINFFTL